MAKETTSVLTAVLHGSKAPTEQQLQRFTDFLQNTISPSN